MSHQQLATDVQGASVALALRSLPASTEPTSKKDRSVYNDPYGRSGRVQVLHIELWYADGTKGELNLTSPHIAWGSDIENQCRFVREYLHKEHEALGIVRYRPHSAHVRADGVLRISWSWFAFDLIANQEIRE